jgi:signal transduction histidine kinase
MSSITYIIKYTDGTHDFVRGELFPLPPELTDKPRINEYLKSTQPGWSTTEFGYFKYTHQHNNGDLFIYPGLIIDGQPKPTKKFANYRTVFSKKQIENLASSRSSYSDKLTNKISSDFDKLVHDLRKLSTSIYHAAEEASTFLDRGQIDETKTRLQNIIAAQSMLTIRTDVLDYSGKPDEFKENELVPIYKRVHKVVRSFMPHAWQKGIKLELSGTSFGHSLGPNVFEIVPYLIIENAIKYAPRSSGGISVNCRDYLDTIEIEIISMGPHIEDDELDEIFGLNYRGRNALKSNTPGSGAGLALARRLVDDFNGNIEVISARPSTSLNNVPQSLNTFRVILPLVDHC